MTLKCDVAGCPNEAGYLPALQVPARGWAWEWHDRGTNPPLQIIVKLPLCRWHRGVPKVEEFLTDQTRKIIEIAARGKAPPDFRRARIKCIAIDDPQARLLLSRSAQGGEAPG